MWGGGITSWIARKMSKRQQCFLFFNTKKLTLFITSHYLYTRIMKKASHILLSLLLSTLIFYGGAGVNVFSFCCNECLAKKMNLAVLFVGIECCSNSSEETHHTCCQGYPFGDTCCTVDRIEFDWQSASSNQIQLQPLSIELDNSLFLSAHNAKSATDTSLLYHIINRKSQIPPHLSKDEYFDLLCTLII